MDKLSVSEISSSTVSISILNSASFVSGSFFASTLSSGCRVCFNSGSGFLTTFLGFGSSTFRSKADFISSASADKSLSTVNVESSVTELTSFLISLLARLNNFTNVSPLMPNLIAK